MGISLKCKLFLLRFKILNKVELVAKSFKFGSVDILLFSKSKRRRFDNLATGSVVRPADLRKISLILSEG